MEKLICPKCNVEMNIKNEGNIEIIQCPRCEGVWVDNFEEKQVLEMEPAIFTVDELRRLRSMYKPDLTPYTAQLVR